ncbi:glycoside hydrolase family 43 protein [Pontibacter beigongshangensis]|uniref:glycoside hydrolase family 43 protein n=1 Tax=Pontibacter beigongshangensis TaxID=2574733 RepID=UPI00164F080E|nr:glycoside hydrolase family 43 protein [Pontibacter beigongshangensis]
MIKQNLLFLLALWLFASCGSAKEEVTEETATTEEAAREVYMFSSFREPADEGLRLLYSYDGYKWEELEGVFLKPDAGKGKLMRDPSIVTGPDGTFHLVWTTAWRGDNGFGYASSKDLVNWSEQQFVDVMKHEPTTVNVWAPELFYDDENERYIIIWASTIPNRFPRGVEAEDNNHRMYYTTTKDFKTFTETKLFMDPDFSIIDAVIVKRDKNDYVQVLKDNTRPNRNLKVAFATDPLGPYSNISEPFTGNFIEGPTVLKVGDDWLIYYDVYEKKIYGGMKTRDFKTFTDITEELQIPEGHKHGTIFKANEEVLQNLLNRTEAP